MTAPRARSEERSALQENAITLLRKQAHSKIWNDSMAPYWASLPLAQSSDPLKGVHLLQDELLASTMIMHDAYTRNVFEGGKPELVQRSAEELSRLSVEEFLQLVRVVRPPRHAADQALI